MFLHRSPSLPLFAIAVAVILAVTGCASSHSPSAGHSLKPHVTASASATPRVSPTPKPTAAAVTTAKIVIDGTGLTVLGSDGSQLARVLYASDPAPSLATLVAKIGATPSTTVQPEGMCSPSVTVADWGRFRMTWYTDPAAEAGAGFTVRADAATVSGIAVQSPQGFTVGNQIAAMHAGTPGSQLTPAGDQLWYDLDSNQRGALAQSQDFGGPILFFYAPAYTNQDC